MLQPAPSALPCKGQYVVKKKKGGRGGVYGISVSKAAKGCPHMASDLSLLSPRSLTSWTSNLSEDSQEGGVSCQGDGAGWLPTLSVTGDRARCRQDG